MAVVHFDEIGITRKKSGKCPVCGKTASRSQSFYQTRNPFNVNSAGSVKSVEDIKSQNEAKASEWIAEPVFHARCQ